MFRLILLLFFSLPAFANPPVFTVGTDPIIDITNTGTGLSLGDDNMSGMKPLGFDFDFYGSTFDEVNISMNGFFTFQDNFSVPRNRNYLSEVIPATSFNYTVFPLWSDFIRRTSGNASPYIQTFGQTSDTDQYFVVMWDNVSEYSNQLKSTFQAILYEGTNAIEFRYDKIQIKTHDITIGVQGNNEAVTYLRYEDTGSTTYIKTEDWSLTTAEVIDESYDNLTSECLISSTYSTLCDVYDLSYQDDTIEDNYLLGSGLTDSMIYGYDSEEEFYGYSEEDESLYGGTIVFEVTNGWDGSSDFHDDIAIDSSVYVEEDDYVEEEQIFEFVSFDDLEEEQIFEFVSFDDVEELETTSHEQPETLNMVSSFDDFVEIEVEELALPETHEPNNTYEPTNSFVEDRNEENLLLFADRFFYTIPLEDDPLEEELEEEEVEEEAEEETEEATEEEEESEEEVSENRPRRQQRVNAIVASTNNMIDNLTSNAINSSSTSVSVSSSPVVASSSPISMSNSPSISDQIQSSQIQTHQVLQSITIMPMPSVDNTPSVVMAEVQITRMENQIQSAVSTVVTASEADQISTTMGGEVLSAGNTMVSPSESARIEENTIVSSSEADQIAETIIASNIRNQQELSQQQEGETGEYDTQGQSNLISYMNYTPEFNSYKELSIPDQQNWYESRIIYQNTQISDNMVALGELVYSNSQILSGMINQQNMEFFQWQAR